MGALTRRLVFNSHGGDSELVGRDGSTVDIIGKLSPDEYDECETGPMYKVRFADGFVTDAFMDEIEIEYGF